MKRLSRWLKAWRPLPLVLACLVVVGCGSELPSPCDSVTAAAISAKCTARVQVECVNKDIPADECPVIAECDREAEARTKRCGGGS